MCVCFIFLSLLSESDISARKEGIDLKIKGRKVKLKNKTKIQNIRMSIWRETKIVSVATLTSKVYGLRFAAFSKICLLTILRLLPFILQTNFQMSSKYWCLSITVVPFMYFTQGTNFQPEGVHFIWLRFLCTLLPGSSYVNMFIVFFVILEISWKEYKCWHSKGFYLFYD